MYMLQAMVQVYGAGIWCRYMAMVQDILKYCNHIWSQTQVHVNLGPLAIV